VRASINGQVLFDPAVDNERVHDEEIAPLVERLTEICRREGIPMVLGVQFSVDGIAFSVTVSPGCSANIVAAARIFVPERFADPAPSTDAN
jgi:hypothetical protein